MTNTDLIIGIHSIVEALQNRERNPICLYATADGIKNLKNKIKLDKIELKELTLSKFIHKTESLFREKRFKYSRIQAQALLLASSLPEKNLSWIYQQVEKKDCLLLAIDSLTDTHNLAAIVRTAAFYNVDGILLSRRGKLTLTPHIFRVSSGALEHLFLINCSSLPGALSRLQDRGVSCVGLAEEADGDVFEQRKGSHCLVMGAEDKGLSHAVRTCLSQFVGLKARGRISSLNVSVATAITLERFLNQRKTS